ncbi:MAG: hypothetical protein NT113_06250 [Hyphomicrobiales bacterium]|nr:hypothetical protein [Hyphomicrobiales bacterium]
MNDDIPLRQNATADVFPNADCHDVLMHRLAAEQIGSGDDDGAIFRFKAVIEIDEESHRAARLCPFDRLRPVRARRAANARPSIHRSQIAARRGREDHRTSALLLLAEKPAKRSRR